MDGERDEMRGQQKERAREMKEQRVGCDGKRERGRAKTERKKCLQYLHILTFYTIYFGNTVNI